MYLCKAIVHCKSSEVVGRLDGAAGRRLRQRFESVTGIRQNALCMQEFIELSES